MASGIAIRSALRASVPRATIVARGPATSALVRTVMTKQARGNRGSRYGAMAVGAFAAMTLGAATVYLDAPGQQAVDWDGLRKDLADLMDSQPDWDDGSLGPVLVRLAWHASGTFDKGTRTGGSDGSTMRFAPESTDGANAGLDKARAFLEPLKAKYPGVSYADLWTLAGAVAIEEMGGPKIDWKAGRSDKKSADEGVPPNGRLPDAAKGPGKDGVDHLRFIFYKMGFDDKEIVALSGAHALGRCHGDRSGFVGPWTHAPTTFSNQYFVELLENFWIPKTLPNGQVQFRDPEDTIMMLPSDMALLADPVFKKYVVQYARDQDAFFNDFAAAFAKLLELGVKRGGKSEGKSWWSSLIGGK